MRSSLRSLRLRIIPTFAVASLMIQAAAAQQPATPEVLEYKGTVAAARQVEVAPRIDGLLLKINFTAGQLMRAHGARPSLTRGVLGGGG